MSLWNRFGLGTTKPLGMGKKPKTHSFRPQLDQLETRLVPAGGERYPLFAFAPANNAPAHISVTLKPGVQSGLGFDTNFYAFDKSYTSGVNLASIQYGDNYYVAAIANANTHIKTFRLDLKTSGAQVPISSFYAYQGYKGEVDIKAIQSSDGNTVDLITSPINGPSHIKIFDGYDGKLKTQFYAYKDNKDIPVTILLAPSGPILTPSLIIVPSNSTKNIIIRNLATEVSKELVLPKGLTKVTGSILDLDENGTFYLKIEGFYGKSSTPTIVYINLQSELYVSMNVQYDQSSIINLAGSSVNIKEIKKGDFEIKVNKVKGVYAPFGGFRGKVEVGSMFITLDNWGKVASSFTKTEIAKLKMPESKFVYKDLNTYILFHADGISFINPNGDVKTVAGSFNNLYKINPNLGLPVNEAMISNDKNHWFQRFENGMLSGPSDYATYALTGNIYNSWKKLYEAGNDIGIPTSAVYGLTPQLQQFEFGSIVYNNPDDFTFFENFKIGDLRNIKDQKIVMTNYSNYKPIRNLPDFDTNDPALGLVTPKGWFADTFIKPVVRFFEDPAGAIDSGARSVHNEWQKLERAIADGGRAIASIFENRFIVKAPFEKTPAGQYFYDIFSRDISVGDRGTGMEFIRRTNVDFGITGTVRNDIDGTVKVFPNYDTTVMQFVDTRTGGSASKVIHFSEFQGFSAAVRADNVVTAEEAGNMVIDVVATLKALAERNLFGMMDKSLYPSFLAHPLNRSPLVFALADQLAGGMAGINYSVWHEPRRRVISYQHGIYEFGESTMIALRSKFGDSNDAMYTLAHEMGHSIAPEGAFSATPNMSHQFTPEYIELKGLFDKFASLSNHQNTPTGKYPTVDEYYRAHWMDFAKATDDLTAPGKDEVTAAYGYGSVTEDFAEFVAEIYRHNKDFDNYYTKLSVIKKQKVDAVLGMVSLEYPHSLSKKSPFSTESKWSITNPADQLPK